MEAKIRFSILLALCLTACQPQKETVRETVQVAPKSQSDVSASAPTAENTTSGPIDSGGGNGIEGKPLESFRKPLSDTKVMKDVIQPLIEKIARKNLDLAGELTQIATERQWYFVPVKLNTIPSEVIGVHFNTDQLAIQNFGEIWIDSKKFEDSKTTDKDRANLILHELIMGVRLLEFQDEGEQCSAISRKWLLSDKTASEYNKSREACLKEKQKQPREGIKTVHLAEEDYINIRSAGELLMEKLEKTSGEELQKWMKEHNFQNHRTVETQE